MAGVKEGDFDTWIQSPDGAEQVTFDSSYEQVPLWSPDGGSIVFTSFLDDGSNGQIHHLDLGGGTPATNLSAGETNELAVDWASDGAILFARTTPGLGSRLWHRPGSASGRGVAKPMSDADGRYYDADLSPDGKWLVYRDHPRIVVQRFDGTPRGPRYFVAEGKRPRWSKFGNELVFVVDTNKLVSVPVQYREDSIYLGAQQELFSLRSPYGTLPHDYDVTPDGSRFLVVERYIDPQNPTRIDVYRDLPGI